MPSVTNFVCYDLLILGGLIGAIFATWWASDNVPLFHYLYEIHHADRIRLINYISRILESFNVTNLDEVVNFLRKPGSSYRNKFVVSLNYFLKNALYYSLPKAQPIQVADSNATSSTTNAAPATSQASNDASSPRAL